MDTASKEIQGGKEELFKAQKELKKEIKKF